MATLVLSSAGAALGGPVGAAAGRMIGGQIDRGLSGSRSARRLSDFRVQVSHYGSEIPAVYGRMRVAGSVVWATDLIQNNVSGKSGSTNSYTVSFAIAVSSRAVVSVRRIWADGRLIRGAAGDHKIAYTLRLHGGDPDQQVDPLMASSEGLAWTPAYRDVGLLVFEDFDLSTFGNRLPQITVEIDAGDGPMSPLRLLSQVAEISSAEVEADVEVTGYAAQGDSVGAAIAPMIETFAPKFSTSATAWQVGAKARVHIIPQAEIQFIDVGYGSSLASGNSEGDILPSRISLRFFDPAIDYATGEKSARLPGTGSWHRTEFPGAISSEQAKGLAHQILANVWAQRNRKIIALPFHRADIGLGDTIVLQVDNATSFRVVEKSLTRERLQFTLNEQVGAISSLNSDSGTGRKTMDEIAAPLKLVILDGGDSVDDSVGGIYVGISGGQRPFRTVPMRVNAAGRSLDGLSARLPAVTGTLLAPLEAGGAELLDKRNSILLKLNSDDTLVSVELSGLLAGANMAWVGGECLQFASAEEIEPTVFRLTDLLRGRHESAIANIQRVGTDFVLVAADRLMKVPISNDAVGSDVVIEAFAVDGSIARESIVYAGNLTKPWSPTHLSWTQANATMELAWVRRCPAGLSWLDFVDVPDGSWHALYRVTLSAADGSQQVFEVDEPRLAVPSNLAGLGPRPWSFEVRQIGPISLSDAAQLTVF